MGMVCKNCGEDLADTTAVSCTADMVVSAARGALRGKVFTRRRYGGSEGERCRDCGVGVNGIHHFLCARERCPNCPNDMQMLICVCEMEPYDDAKPNAKPQNPRR